MEISVPNKKRPEAANKRFAAHGRRRQKDCIAQNKKAFDRWGDRRLRRRKTNTT